MPTKDVLKHDLRERTATELADAHCHLDLMTGVQIGEAIEASVKTMITNGVDIKSDMQALRLADGRNVFAMLGIDPEHSVSVKPEELDVAIGLIRGSIGPGVVGIGEIGLDGKTPNMEWQRKVFGEAPRPRHGTGAPCVRSIRGARLTRCSRRSRRRA